MAQSWFDQSPAGNLGIYGGGQPQPIIAPPVQEAPQIDIASAAREYAKKKRMAEALRGRAGSLDMSQRSPTIVSEGANGSPGEVQVNWGGIAENALMPWMRDRQEDKALGAEDEAAAERSKVLDGIDYNNLDPKTAMKLQDLGIDVSGYVKKPVDLTKQAAQYGMTSAGMRNLNVLQPGLYSDQMIAETEAREKEAIQTKLQNDLAKAAAGRSVSNTTVNTGSDEGEFQKKVAGIQATRLGEVTKAYQSSGAAIQAADVYDQWANDPANEGVVQEATRLASQMGFAPAEAFLTPSTKRAMMVAAEDVRRALKDLGGSDSNSDVIWANKSLPTGAITMEQARAMSTYYREQAKVLSAAAQSEVQWLSNPENRGGNVMPPNFYLEARKNVGSGLDAAQAAVESAPVMPAKKEAPASKVAPSTGKIDLSVGG